MYVEVEGNNLRIISKFRGDMEDNPKEVPPSDQNFLQHAHDPKPAISLVISKPQERKSKMGKSRISKSEKIKPIIGKLINSS